MTRALLLLALVATGCGSDDAPGPGPLQPVDGPARPATASAAPPPATAPAIEAGGVEGDPAVVALRAYQEAVARALNDGDLGAPALAALSTPARQAQHQELYGAELGLHQPGPLPVAVLGVERTQLDVTSLVVCALASGWALDGPGGTPTAPRTVSAGVYVMRLVDGAWKVDEAYRDGGRSCDGVEIPEERFP